MSVISEDSIFTSLQQQGPMAVEDSIDLTRPFSRQTREWVRKLASRKLNATKYRALRSQIFEFLGISSFCELETLVNPPRNSDPEKIKALAHERSRRACTLLGNMFGLSGSHGEVEARVYEYARTADNVVNSLSNKILRPYASFIAITNEIEVANDPVTLLLIMFNNRYHKKARFEARRKLVLMNLAGSIDQRERETKIEEKFSTFLHFLNDFVWSRNLKIGEHEIVYLLSQHAETDFACLSVKALTPDQASQVKLGKNEKLTLLKRRRFTTSKKDIPIYVSIRKKPPEAKVLKLLRKNEKNPAVAVDDELGLMAVLDSVANVKIFQNHLAHSATKDNSLVILEDISDTLTGSGNYKSAATGSSSQTEMLKFFARLGGMRVEFIIHTNRSWLNYMYQRDVAHDEYEVKRIFDSGVVELLFPKDIFNLDHKMIRDDMIGRFRKHIEE